MKGKKYLYLFTFSSPLRVWLPYFKSSSSSQVIYINPRCLPLKSNPSIQLYLPVFGIRYFFSTQVSFPKPFGIQSLSGNSIPLTLSSTRLIIIQFSFLCIYNFLSLRFPVFPLVPIYESEFCSLQLSKARCRCLFIYDIY